MKIEMKDIDEWTIKDFVYYIKSKLLDEGIEYQIKYPFDMIIIGKLVKNFKNKGKTNFFIKKSIDKVFEEFSFNNINSLQCFPTLVRNREFKNTKNEKKYKKLPNREFALSNKLLKKLKKLKTVK
ncbi:MAG: hypothetical protein QXV60_02545 [Nitrososphaerota archaeon]